MATQQITGLASGLDTASIIESLMAIQRTTYDKTSEKVQMEKLKLQAYQSINSMLYSFKDTVNNLASSALWNGKMATSSNDGSLKASVTQYAAEGSYSLRVGQLATAAQYLSKGFSSSSSKIISANSGVTSGSITLESSQARVDNSAKLEDLNGGNGVYRGSIRITDAAGSSAVVDISTCETLDQVITAINNAAGVQIKAQIQQNPDGTSTGDRLEIVDTSGGSGTLRVQNVGSGTAATDLGIAKTSTPINGTQTIEGSSIWYMSNNTSLSLLNDGLGVEEGYISLDIAGALGTAELYFNVDGCETVGDIMNVINQVLSQTVELGRQPGATAEQIMAADYCDGLQIEINADRNGFSFTGGQTNLIYTLTNAQQANAFGNLTPATQLGMLGTYTVSSNGGSFECARVFGDVSSPMLSNVSGVNQTGIGTEGSRQKVTSNTLDGTTLLSALNGGAGILSGNGFTFYVHQGGDANGVHATYSDIFDTNVLRSIATDPTATVDDLLLYLNTTLSTCGIDALESLQIAIDPSSKGLYFTGLSNGYAYEVGGDLATSLGLVYLEDGDPSRGWGAMLKGSDYEDPTVASLFDAVDIRNGTMMLYESHTLADLFSPTDIARVLAPGSLNFTIGTCSFSVDLTGLDENTTLAEFMKEVNDQIAAECEAHDPTMMVPKIQIHYLSEGLSFTNVDLSQPLIVTGDAADVTGIARNYAGMTFSSFNTTTQLNLNPTMTGTYQQQLLTGSELLSSLNAGAGISLLGNELTISFGPEGSQESITLTRDEIIAEMGGGHFGAYTLNQYVAALNSLANQKISADPALAGADIQFGLTAEGITVVNAQSANDGDLITIGGDMATASSTGLNAWEYEYDSGVAFVSPDAADIRSVTSTAVAVAGLGTIEFEWNGTTVTLHTNDLGQSSTLNDLIGYLNKQLVDDWGITNMSFGISDSGSGISFTNNSDKAVTFIYDDVNTLASDLGLAGAAGSGENRTVAGNGHYNAASLNRNYISRATTLASLNHGQGADLGTFIITNAAGTSVRIDMSEALTIGDAIDFINGALYGVQARINAAGDGIEIVQTALVDNDGNPITGNISVTSADGTKTAEHLGIAGTGSRDEYGYSVLNGSMKTVIDIGANDTLNDVMTRISELDGYTATIINDGTGANSYRLSIKSSSTGAGYDFIIDSDLDVLGMQQVTRGQDSMVLYGDPDSGMSPVVLKSSTNTNNQAIQGMTLELLATSESYTTITVSADTESAVQEIQNLVQAYNDLSDLITYLDSYDTVNETKGILFSDSNVRTLMSTIDDVFFQVFNPDNLTYADLVASGKKSTWTWTDLGISFSTNNTNTDGESGNWYSRMELDLDTLNEMVVNNWDQLKEMLSSQRNISDSTLASNIAATSYFNFQPEYDSLGNIIKPADQWDPNGAINGNRSSSNFGDGNGFEANKTIAEGENQYTIYFQQTTTLDRVSIYHPNSADYPASDYALKDFVVEYLNPNTGQWEVMREITNNSSSSTILGFAVPVTTSAIRITANTTNAEDGKFRLLDVQCLETNGLAGKLNRTINELTDVVDGFFTLANESVEDRISSLQEQMERMETRLTKKEEALWRKFNAMESALSKLQSQSNYFTTMMSSMLTSSS